MMLLLFPILFLIPESKQIFSQPELAPSLLELSQSSLTRDESLIPSSLNSNGDDYSSGSTYFLLVSTFIENDPGTGKVWVVPTDPDLQIYSYELLVGLDRPTGVCFDVNHHFLYIVDNTFDGNGKIYQYEIDWETDEKFILSRNVYVIVYTGKSPYDCKVDEYGNLFFLEAEYDSINIISYLDLYSGFTNMNYTIYESDPYVSYPVSIDVIESKDIYYANLYNGDEVGSVNRADAISSYVNGGKVDVLVKNTFRTWGVAHSAKDFVFFSLDTGEVWTVKDNDPSKKYQKTLQSLGDVRGMCYGQGKIYVAEFQNGTVWQFNDNSKAETPTNFVGLQGAYSVFCVNSATAILAVLIWVFI